MGRADYISHKYTYVKSFGLTSAVVTAWLIDRKTKMEAKIAKLIWIISQDHQRSTQRFARLRPRIYIP